jgi:hypothetical protein
MHRPIFICASGWRCGSTLLQRLLCSHPEVHIWGENRGICVELQRLYQQLVDLQPLSEHAGKEYKALGTNGWIAMLNPPLEEFSAGIGALIVRYFGEPVRAMGKSRWGFKEVRHGGATVEFLHRLFPDARFLLLVRDPWDCLASARATTVQGQTHGLLPEVGDAAAFLEHWARIAESFLQPWPSETALRMRYEDLLTMPERTVERLSEFLDVSHGGFSSKTFGVARRGWLEEDPRLTDSDRQSLSLSSVWSVARHYGYTPRT